MDPPHSGVGKQSASPPRQNMILVQVSFSHRSCRVQDLQHALLPVNLDLKNNKVNKHTEIAKKKLIILIRISNILHLKPKPRFPDEQESTNKEDYSFS